MFDAFIKIDGIKGESTDDQHKDWIEILSFSFGITQSASASKSSSGGAGTGRADFHDFSFVKTVDTATPDLCLKSASGEHIGTIEVELCRSGGDKFVFLTYKMSDVIISSVTTGGSSGNEDGLPTDTVSLNYGKIEWGYVKQKREGGAGGGNIKGGWDLKTNKKV